MTSLPNERDLAFQRSDSEFSEDQPRVKKYDKNKIFSNQKIQELSFATGDTSTDQGSSFMNKKRKKKKNKDTDDSIYSDRDDPPKSVKDYDINVMLTD